MMLPPPSCSKGLTRQYNVRRDTLALIMAGGNGSRLGSLTNRHSKPALSFAGAYRNIDFTLSNCVNAGLRRIAVLTQYNAHSLLHHIIQNWSFLNLQMDEFVELWPAQKRNNEDWFLGTANAIAQNMDLIREHAPKYTVILAGDHIYKMDYSGMLRFHQRCDAQLTVASVEVPIAKAPQFGVLGVDQQDRIQTFEEKPAAPRAKPGSADKALASMGVYVFSTDFLLRALEIDADNNGSSHDFGRDILPWAIRQPAAAVYAYPFRDQKTGEPGYWRDVGTIDAYWEAHMDLLAPVPALSLYDQDWPLMPCSNSATPARISLSASEVPGLAVDSLVGGGCVLERCQVRHSLLSSNVTVDAESTIENSVILPGARIGTNCQLNHVIVEGGCEVPSGTVIGMDQSLDQQRFAVSSGGVVLVTHDALSANELPHQNQVA